MMGRRPLYLLSGLLKCNSCGHNYIMANKVNYQCSSQKAKRANCDQRKVIKRADVERNLLAGIKEQLLDPKLIKEMARKVRAEVRKAANPSSDSRARAKTLDRQIADIADTICEVGHSEALSAKLRELEAEKQSLPVQRQTAVPVIAGVENTVKGLVENLENLRDFAKRGEVEEARDAIRKIIGEVVVVEESDGIDLYPRLSANIGEMSGAENWVP